MTTVSRQGLRIEQCEGCRGVFLDRGELEQIIDAEQRHYDVGMPHGGHHADSPAPYRGGRHPDSPPPFGGRRRKRSFLSELFD